MAFNLNQLDRRRFIRGSGAALALPFLSSTLPLAAATSGQRTNPKRLACIYFPDGVPMPLRDDPAYEDWSWFPHGAGTEFTFTKCTDVFQPLRSDLTVLSGFSHPEARKVHPLPSVPPMLSPPCTSCNGHQKWRRYPSRCPGEDAEKACRRISRPRTGRTGPHQNGVPMTFFSFWKVATCR